MRYYINLPKVDDDIVFDLDTTKNGVLANPFSFEKVTIYYLERSFRKNTYKYSESFYNQELQSNFEKQQEVAFGNPTDSNLEILAHMRNQLERSALKTNIYYNNAKIVMSTVSPLWVKDGVSKIVNAKNAKQEVIDGKFIFVWKPQGMREGSYIIRWEWREEKGDKTRTAEKLFNIGAEEIDDLNLKLCPRDKYEQLFLKYLPLMYFKKTRKNDLTPAILEKLNKSIGQGFLEIEDMATRLFTLLDPTTIKSDFLPLLANQFKLNLKSNDKLNWRNQIRGIVPLYKQKGTLNGLRNALDKCGVHLVKLTNLWQVVSPYTWTDGFVISGDDITEIGYLTKKPIDMDLEVAIRSLDEKSYHILDKDCVLLQETGDFRTSLIWKDESIRLLKGDVVRIKYKYRNIPDNVRSVENYIQKFLPLADKRDERTFKYPLKNWNVRLIAEDDPVFNLLVQERHPLTNSVVFGKIRTTFMYSEKVWNMDTYNGSLYNSNNPCDMDKDFVDTCSNGQSSMFDLHLECEQVSDDKIMEIKEIVKEYSPFHAILNRIVINNKVTDIILPPEEILKGEVKKKSKKGIRLRLTRQFIVKLGIRTGGYFKEKYYEN